MLFSELKKRAVFVFCARTTGFNLLPSHHITTFYLAPAATRANTPSLRVRLQTSQMSLVSEVGSVEYGSLCRAIWKAFFNWQSEIKNKPSITGSVTINKISLFIISSLVRCPNALHSIELLRFLWQMINNIWENVYVRRKTLDVLILENNQRLDFLMLPDH